MLIGFRQRLCTFQSVPNLTINGTPIKQVFQAKSLGVYVDENFSWTTHINEITKKIASRVLTFSGYDASADPLIEILGWQKLES